MNQSIKQLRKERDSCFSKYQSQGRRDKDLHIVTSLTDKIIEKIPSNRKSYFQNLSDQLNDKWLNPKKYWILLRSFYNGRKVPLILPILKSNKCVSDFKGAVKSYFTHYSSAVFILFNTGLCKSAFSTNSFRKLVFFIILRFLSFLPVMCRI